MYHFTKDTMNKQRITIIILAITGIVSSFLPWGKESSRLGSHVYDGFESGGVVTMILFAIPLLLSFIGKFKSPLRGTKLAVAILSSLFAFIFGLWRLSRFYSDVQGTFSTATHETGLLLVILTGIGLPVVAALLLLWKNKNQTT